MARLIDADAAVELLRSLGSRDYRREKGTIADAMKMLLHPAYTPTVDAVEVVHGRWEDVFGGKYANPRFRCSVCNQKALHKFEPDALHIYKEVQALTPYCPNCGAKMDGGADDGN